MGNEVIIQGTSIIVFGFDPSTPINIGLVGSLKDCISNTKGLVQPNTTFYSIFLEITQDCPLNLVAATTRTMTMEWKIISP